ncbi:SMODS domain-containing nucleotidyltransferase [Syntrophomonas palmitatica]|uniref:SMODS domain-containing nucleotidyltransferase n=1 Tax=Syntrophomonas palmitatica TaxID=402877 RepID=UPI0006D25B82|nr:hypothetical protein [Syntrophomonas palmitatica]
MQKTESIADKFKTFLNNIKVDNHDIIIQRGKEIALAVNNYYWHIKSDTRNVFYLGSFGRDTAINELDNVNIMVVLPLQIYERLAKWPGNVQRTLLRETRDFMSKINADAFINDEHCLMMPYKEKPLVEVIPAFAVPKKNGYIYPDPSEGGRWQEFNPIREIEVIDEYNYKYGGKVKHIARMTRAWKFTHKVVMPSMLIDTMAMNFMEDWEGAEVSYGYYGNMMMDFMEYLAGRRKEQLDWYAKGSNRKLHREDDFGAPANDAYKKAVEALSYEEKGESYNANRCWKEIFGEKFPG